ncbi:MAG: methyltransferase domain-containing protein [Steroidobacteraceae bacterium]
MLAEASVAPGQHVLDIGSGDGEMAVAAAAIVGPAGRVLATDVSLERLDGLARNLPSGPPRSPIEVQACAAEDLALPPGSFDVALARNCVMYFRDLERALRNVHVALRPGSRCVASVYGPLEREPFHAIPIAAVQRRCDLTEPLPEYAQAFRLGAADLRAALRRAGFRDAHVRTVAVTRTYPSVSALLGQLRASRSLGELLSCLPESDVDHAWQDIDAGFRAFAGPASVRIPGEQVVVTGTT